MMRAMLRAASVLAPGLPLWADSRSVLAGERPLAPEGFTLPPPPLLSATERRRAGMPARLALAVAEEAARRAGIAPGSLRTVFGSSNGEGAVLHAILDTLSGPDPAVSPTQFHNSVHNAVAGYWSIGTGSARPATCLGAHDDTVAATLLQALAEVVAEREPVLLCLYDAPIPPPLGTSRPTATPFAAALVLTPEDTSDPDTPMGRIGVRYAPEPAAPAPWEPRAPGLAALAGANPSARVLRLLENVASHHADTFSLPWLDGSLEVAYDPCPTAPRSSP